LKVGIVPGTLRRPLAATTVETRTFASATINDV
ncbi:uncharacterized protein METZ01_LOCUS268438, partial [marine metagenome]